MKRISFLILVVLLVVTAVDAAMGIKITSPENGQQYQVGSKMVIRWEFAEVKPAPHLKPVLHQPAITPVKPALAIFLYQGSRQLGVIAMQIPGNSTSYVWKVGEFKNKPLFDQRLLQPPKAPYQIVIVYCPNGLAYKSASFFILPAPSAQGPKINSIEPFYDDCQMILHVKGVELGNMQGPNRIIRMKSGAILVDPQITAWTSNQVDCLLKGEFALGHTYQVYLFDTVANAVLSNQYNWLAKTQIKIPNQVYHVGNDASMSGCLLGAVQGPRQVMVGNTPAVVKIWCCEDIVFTVPNLPAGVYNVVLKEGGLVLSNQVTINIE